MAEAVAATPTIPIYDISGQEPVLGEIAHGEVTDAVASGKYSLPQGKVPVLSPDGTLGHIDASEAPQAFQNGYSYATPHDINNSRFSTPSEQFKAGLEGAARGVAGPLATLAERSLGVPAENIQARQEANPGTAIGSEIAGLAAPALLTGGASTAARMGLEGAAGVADALKAAEGFTQAGLLEKAGQAITGGMSTATPLAKIGSQAVKSAAENAIFAAGNEANSAILQDPNQDLGYAAANVALSGLIGGGLGAGVGAVPALWEATKGTKVNRLLSSVVEKLGGTDSGIVPDAAKAAMDRTGIQVAPELQAGMSDIPEVKEAFNSVFQRDTTKSGMELQKSVKNFYDTASDNLAGAFGKTPEELSQITKGSDYEMGNKIAETLGNELNDKIKPISTAYENIKEKYGKYDLPGARTTLDPTGALIEQPSQISKIADDIAQLQLKEGWAKDPSGIGMKEAQRVINDLPLQKNVNDISNLIRSNNARMASDPMNGTLRNTMSKLNAILRSAEGDSIVSHLGAEAGEGATQDFLATRSNFGKMADLTDTLDSRLHIKGSSTSGYGNAVKEMAADRGETFLRRITNTKDAALLNLIQEQLPQTASAIREMHVNNILQSALDDSGKIRISKLSNTLDKLSPELKNFSVPQEALEKTKAVKTLSDALKYENYNWSNSARTNDKLQEHMTESTFAMITSLLGLKDGEGFGQLLKHGATGFVLGKLANILGKDVPDRIKLGMLKFLGSDKEISSGGFKAMVDFLDHARKGESTAANAIKSLLKGTSLEATSILPKSLSVDDKDRQKLDKTLDKYSKNPQSIIDLGGKLGHYLPDHAAALGSLSANAINYLNSLKPKTESTNPLDTKNVPNSVQKANYNSALTIAQSPLTVLSKIKQGNLTTQDVTHLKTLYPALYASLEHKLSMEMVDHLSKGGTVPYRVRMGIALFTGNTLDSTMTPMAISMAQPTPQQPTSEQGNMTSKVGSSKAQHLSKLPNTYETAEQARVQRQQKS